MLVFQESISSTFYMHVFLYESELSSFSLITFVFVIFGAKILYKPSRKASMKLTAALANFERISIRILAGITIMLKRKVRRILG